MILSTFLGMIYYITSYICLYTIFGYNHSNIHEILSFYLPALDNKNIFKTIYLYLAIRILIGIGISLYFTRLKNKSIKGFIYYLFFGVFVIELLPLILLFTKIKSISRLSEVLLGVILLLLELGVTSMMAIKYWLPLITI